VSQTKITIEVEATVDYTYHPACRGARDSCCGVRGAGPALEPDEPAHVEINSITVEGGNVRDELPKMTLEAIELECLEIAEEPPEPPSD
jgi:hypothetical protein